ncbi:zinc finger CW-type PWWP domain protein 1-like isoform X2 [Mytilus edulis]|uniref:zinc finger CW-type PWWP domain protein 1-like isoform X2 n=1 Tax=Mytilus edulis TaxID=6550 RepID=UPI0039F08CC9
MTDPKKPCFKKTFAVPKLKAEVKAENLLLSPKNLFKTAENNTARSEIVQVQPSSGKCDDSNDVIDKEQDKENTAVVPKKVKSKKSLFQAPCTSDIEKKEVKEESSEKTKKKGTKKSLKVKSNVDDNVDVSKPKKVKKDKECADKTENLTKPKKPKKKKSDTEVQKEAKATEKQNETKATEAQNETKATEAHNEAKAGEDHNVEHEENSSIEKEDKDDEVKNGDEMVCTEENEESICQPAIENEKNNDDSNEIKSQQEQKNEEAQSEIQIKKAPASDGTTKEASKPPRSLSDQEYEEIFQAVLDRCNNTSLEEMYESLNKPVKEKKQKERKAIPEKVTKPKQIKTTNTKKPKEQTQAQVVPTSKKFDKKKAPKKSESKTDVKVQEEKQSENECNSDEELQSEEELDVLEFENVDEVEECQALSQLIPDEVINGLQGISNTVEPNFQDVNEETPEGSEVDYKLPVQKTPPPKKIKKSENHSSIKKQKLAPKQLNFPKKIEELKKESTKSETKSSKKKLKMEVQVSKKPTREKETDKLASKEKSRKKEMQERYLTREKLGTWVQCGDKNCSKWRFLPDCEDPSELPEVWTCNMNKDKRYNSCDIEEQNYNEDEHIFTNFAEGSVVWAKMAGFPWWPAMIEIDPDSESYFMLMTPYSMYPSHYHVVFFDDKVSRAWINSTSIKKYTEDEDMTPKPTKGGKGYASFSKDLVKAKTNALLAYDMSVSDRLKNFSFAKRYRGTYGKVYQSDSSQESPKPKKKPKIRKRKVEEISSGMIDSALEEDDNEEAVLKGIESVLDAIDDELDAMDEDSEDEDDEDFKMSQEESKTNITKHGDDKKKTLKGDEDFKMSDEEENKIKITNHGDEKKKLSKETKQNSRQKPNKKAGEINKDLKMKSKIKKPKMFEEEDEEEEMVVPSIPVKSLKFDSDVFTMDMNDDLSGDSNTTDNNGKDADDKSLNLEGKEKDELKNTSTALSVNSPKFESENSICIDEDAVVHADNAQNDSNFENDENCDDSDSSQSQNDDDSDSSQSQNNDKSENSQNQNEQSVETTNTSKEDTLEENSATHIDNDSVSDNSSPDNETSCTNVATSHDIEMDDRSQEVLSLEQDEQMVPGEEPAHTDEELNLEISNPIEDKHPSQVINRTIAPVTIELAYDSDPFDMEE